MLGLGFRVSSEFHSFVCWAANGKERWAGLMPHCSALSQQSQGEVDRTRDWDGLCLVSDSHKGSQDRIWHLGLFQFFPTGSLLTLPLDLHLQPGVMCGEGD